LNNNEFRCSEYPKRLAEEFVRLITEMAERSATVGTIEYVLVEEENS
jgi:hypothetical protein